MKKYLCIDFKSFYASVECAERGLDPMSTRLVVADPSRCEGTICLAVSPALKKLGVKNRCRIFEIPKDIDYIEAVPRMSLYIEYSADIYCIYMKYLAPEDIQVYSIDEAFLYVTPYLKLYGMNEYELAVRIMRDIYDTKHIPSACGIGDNLYLAKIALDISAKHSSDGIGVLTEESYIRTLWHHRPITDFWRIGRGTAKRLSDIGIFTMKDIAMAEPALLYKTFGIDAELMIDHAWGRESTQISDIKSYSAKTHSLSSGQVLMREYKYDEGMIVLREMVDTLALELVRRKLVTDSISLRLVYRHPDSSAHASRHISLKCSSPALLIEEFLSLYTEIALPSMNLKRIYIDFNNVVEESQEQADIFHDIQTLDRDKRLAIAVNKVKLRYGKNSMLKATSLQSGATGIQRNSQIGGHRS